MSGPELLFSEREIAARVAAMARTIASSRDRPEVLAPVLVGAFVFAADLARALAREGLDLPVEFLWLKSYGADRVAGEVVVLAGPGESVRGKHVLLIDGVLDNGSTLATARDLLMKAGARKVSTAVVVDKEREAAPIRADHVCFAGVEDFIVGYGMDDAGLARGLAYIGRVG